MLKSTLKDLFLPHTVANSDSSEFVDVHLSQIIETHPFRGGRCAGLTRDCRWRTRTMVPKRTSRALTKVAGRKAETARTMTQDSKRVSNTRLMGL